MRIRLPESGGAKAASLAAETAEDDGMNDAEARAGEHGDGQLGIMGMWMVTRSAGFEFGESRSMAATSLTRL